MHAFDRHSGKRARLALLGVVVCVAALLAVALDTRSAASATAPATVSRSATVKIKSFEFIPHKLSISKGTTVVWTNKDGVKHTATRAGSFTTGKIKPGHSAAVRFTAKGTYAYHCKIHPEMHGKIIVG
jgi:plastocyanin